MAHVLQGDSWDLDCLLRDNIILVPDSCADDSIMGKVHDSQDPAALRDLGATPPPCHTSPMHHSMLPSEDDLGPWGPSLLTQLTAPHTLSKELPRAKQAMPQACQGLGQASHTTSQPQGAQAAWSPQPQSQATQAPAQASQGLSQASQGMPQGAQAAWWLDSLSQALLDVPSPRQASPELRHEVPGSSPKSVADEAGGCRSPASPARPGASRRGRRVSQSPREKLYERKERFDDPVQEKKRIDAINSKKNRDRRAAELSELREKVERYTRHRDTLLREVQALRQREADLQRHLNHTPTHSPAQSPLTPPTPAHQHVPVTASPPPPYHAHHITIIPPTPPTPSPGRHHHQYHQQYHQQ